MSGAMLSALLGATQMMPSFPPAPQQVTTAYIQPARWSYSCPENVQGTDGQPLCSAKYDYPALTVARVDEGMTLTIPAKCRRVINRFGKEVDVYDQFQVRVPLKADTSKQNIRNFIVNYLSNLPGAIRRKCGKGYGKDKYEIKDSDLQPMIDVVFLNKRSPF